MKNTKITLLFICVCGMTSTMKAYLPQSLLRIKEVPFTKVHIMDTFWASRIETNRTVSIPSAFKQCEKNGRFDNFAIAGGLMKGEQKGDFPFDDTDPYKIIEGASYSLAAHYDKKLDAYLDSVIHLIASAQETDGYITTCVTNKCYRLSGWWGTHKWERLNSHELYNSGHLIEAAVAHYKATGKKTLLNVAIKNADLICKVFGPNPEQKHVPSGHPIVEMALCKLYKVTNSKKYLDMAKYFIDETGRGTDGHRLSEYSQDYKPILQQNEILGHAVRAGYLYSGVADMASLTNDTTYFKALTRIWDNMAGKKLYITGGMGSRAQGEGFGPNYELHNMQAYAETCASIANVFWNQRMFLATGDAKYADVVERAIYNGVLSGVSLSGDHFFYDNPLESMGQHQRQEWFGCACCPGNITRFVASVPNYMYAILNDEIYINQYIQSSSTIATAHNRLNITQETKYPWDGHIRMTIKAKSATPVSIKIRIPGWVQNSPVPTDLYHFIDKPRTYTIKLNGERVTGKLTNGYVTLTRRWKKNDLIDLNLPMVARQIQAIDSVEDDQGKLALERGPIVYCLEGVDQKDSTVFNKIIPANTLIESVYKPEKLNGIVELNVQGKELQKDGTTKDITLKAIPYSVWDNRGSDQMAVWVPQETRYARTSPNPSIASRAHSVVLQSAIQKDAPASTATEEEAWGINDQWEPKSSSDISKPYFYWWQKVGVPVSIAYTFDNPETVHNVQVYWLDFDQYDGNFRVPESWTLYYKEGDEWKPVETTESYNVKKDCYNSLNFKTVTTTGLKIVAQLQKDASGGIIEWKVN